MLDESIIIKVRCLMEKVLMGFDERNALITNFLKAIFSVTGSHFDECFNVSLKH